MAAGAKAAAAASASGRRHLRGKTLHQVQAHQASGPVLPVRMLRELTAEPMCGYGAGCTRLVLFRGSRHVSSSAAQQCTLNVPSICTP